MVKEIDKGRRNFVLEFLKKDSLENRENLKVSSERKGISRRDFLIALFIAGLSGLALYLGYSFFKKKKEEDREKPKLSYDIEFESFDDKDFIKIIFSPSDNKGIKESYVKINDQLLENQLFQINLNSIGDLDIQFYARDLAGNEASEEVYFEKDDLIKELFKSYVSSKGYTFNENELEQILSIDLVKELFKDYSLRKNLESLFSYLSNNFEDGFSSIGLISQELSNYEIYQAKKIFKDLIKFLDEEEFYNVNQLNSKALTNYFDAISLKGYTMNSSGLNKFLDLIQSFQDLFPYPTDIYNNEEIYQTYEVDRLPFIVWYLVELSNDYYEKIKEYPFAAKCFSKQVASTVYPFFNPKKDEEWSKISYSLNKIFEYHIKIYESGKRILPIKKEEILEFFPEEKVAEMALRQSLLPPQMMFVSMNAEKLSEGKLNKIFHIPDIPNITKTYVYKTITEWPNYLEELREMIDKALRYKIVNDEENDLKRWVLEVIGWPIVYPGWLSYWSNLLNPPDALKVLLVSWNKFTADQYEKAPELVDSSSIYKYIIIHEGRKINYEEIRGNEQISPEDQSSDPNGISEIDFKKINKTTWEIIGAALTALGIYTHENPEEKRVEYSIIYGWIIGYPLFRFNVDYKEIGKYGHGDVGVLLSSDSYSKIKEIDQNSFIPFMITNGWSINYEKARKYLSRINISSLYTKKDIYFPRAISIEF